MTSRPKSPVKVYLIDTNVILRYLLGDHPDLSPKATAFMSAVSQGTTRALILDVVVVECTFVIDTYYGIPRREIAEKLSGIMKFAGIFNPDISEILEALLTYATSTIDIVECPLAAHSSQERIVASFDKDMTRLNAVSKPL